MREVSALALLAGLLVGGGDYAVERRRALNRRHMTLLEVTNIKREVVESWRRERISDLEYFSEDPAHRRDFARIESGDASTRARSIAELDSWRRRQISDANVLLRSGGGHALLESPNGAAECFVRDGIVFSAPVTAAGTMLSFCYPRTNSIMRMMNFWPTGERGVETLLVRRDGEGVVYFNRPGGDQPLRHRSAAPETIMARVLIGGARERAVGLGGSGALCDGVAVPVAGTDWLLVSTAERSATLAPVLANAVLAAVASGTAMMLVLGWALVSVRRTRGVVRVMDAERALLAQAVAQADESIVITDANAVIQYVNPAFTRITGYSRLEAIGRKPNLLKSGKHDLRFYHELWAALARDETWRGRMFNRRKDGSIYEETGSIAPLRDDDGVVTHYIAVKRDMSSEVALEDQLRHSQKMEAVGRLAGGIAHDFNNILTSIMGYAELTIMAAPAGGELADDVGEILKAARLAAALTRQLLTFSRKQIVAPVTLDLGPPVAALEKILRRTLGEDVKLELELSRDPLWVHVDPAQIEQIVINLAVNARDAMPKGGRLRIGAAPADLKRPLSVSFWSVPPGRYASLFVIDEGHGMSPEIQEHIFEPFFTTKEKGRGTGLGLATVFGIVRQAGGHILVDSTPGKGSTFTIFLPLVPAPLPPTAAKAERASPARCEETILLAEDQDEVRAVAERILHSAGYTVLPCRNGTEALAVERAHRGAIDLLLSDVVMPGMGGDELACEIRVRRPSLPVLFMSGYTDEKVASEGVLKPGVVLIQKPFEPSGLLERVRAALDATR